MIRKLFMGSNFFRNLRGNILLKNFAWVISGQFVVKISRLSATMLLARSLSITDYGYVAIIMTVTQYFHIISNSAIQQKVIQCRENDLKTYCQTSWNLQIIVGATAFILQSLTGLIIGNLTGNEKIVLPLIVAGTSHFLNSFSYIQLALLQRYRNFKAVANISNSVLVVNNLTTAVLALAGLGIWSVSISRVIVLPLQIIMTYKAQEWRPIITSKINYWKEIMVFSAKSLGVDILTTSRDSLDYLLIGRFLGVEALGIYYFAFNAGLGITLSISKPLEGAIYSEICSGKDINYKIHAIKRCLKLSCIVILPIVALQSMLSPIYVPLVFGNKWVEAGALPILVLTCLSGATRLPTRTILLAFRALGNINIDFAWNSVFTFVACSAIYVTAQYNIFAVALAIFLLHITLEPLMITMGFKRLIIYRAKG